MKTTTAVLLAAGAGSRLGRGPKALLPYRGLTLVEYLAKVLYDGGCAEVIIVLGAHAARIQEETDLSAHRVVTTDQWEAGMSASLQLGVASAAPEADVLVALVDQPDLSAELIHRLRASHRPGRITAAGYRGSDGALIRRHPVLFGANLAGEAAAAATGDAGAKAYLQTHAGLVDVVDCTDLGDGRDVDIEADLALLGPVTAGNGAQVAALRRSHRPDVA